ncbi:MAG TPA: cysteine hydrolase family protein [Baekduia sp.]|nr:cysteine hydrolase family protein [Baekduia sp.]
MARALLIIDMQRDYFPGGAYPLVAPEAAAANAGRVLAAFRDAGEPVVHLQHVWDAPDATFMKPGTDGVEIHDAVAPAAGETVLQKAQPNGFVGTALESELRSRGVEELVVAGMMSSMCVDATVRAAVDLGFAATVVYDACAAPDLEFGGQQIPGATVHGAFMAALGDGYATLVAADAVG